jgi:hypothetical protein
LEPRKKERKKDILTSSYANMTHETKRIECFVYPLIYESTMMIYKRNQSSSNRQWFVYIYVINGDIHIIVFPFSCFKFTP